MRGCANGSQPLEERAHEVALEQNRVRARLGNGPVQLGVRIPGEGDQAEVRMILPEPRDRCDSVNERHVQVDHDGVGNEVVRELDRVETVDSRTDHRELRLAFDQRLQRFEKGWVVVREQDADRCLDNAVPPGHQVRDSSLAAVSVQPPKREVVVIGAPLDLGQGRRGVDMGPSAIRYAELRQHLTEKLGIVTEDLGNVDAPVAESTEMGDEHARFLAQILELCDRVAKLVAAARRRDAMPLGVVPERKRPRDGARGRARPRRAGVPA